MIADATIARGWRSSEVRGLAVLALSVFGACIVALVFYFEDRMFFGSRDGGDRLTFREQLPYIYFGLQIAVVIGLVTAPFAYVCTRGRSLLRAFVFVLVIVLVVVVVVTPFNAGLAFGASLFELALGLVLCKVLPPNWLAASPAA